MTVSNSTPPSVPEAENQVLLDYCTTLSDFSHLVSSVESFSTNHHGSSYNSNVSVPPTAGSSMVYDDSKISPDGETLTMYRHLPYVYDDRPESQIIEQKSKSIEKNRIAASKYRLRKKAWFHSLKERFDQLHSAILSQETELRKLNEEMFTLNIVNVKFEKCKHYNEDNVNVDRC